MKKLLLAILLVGTISALADTSFKCISTNEWYKEMYKVNSISFVLNVSKRTVEFNLAPWWGGVKSFRLLHHSPKISIARGYEDVGGAIHFVELEINWNPYWQTGIMRAGDFLGVEFGKSLESKIVCQ